MLPGKCVICGYTGDCQQITVGSFLHVLVCEVCSSKVSQGYDLFKRYTGFLEESKEYVESLKK